MWFGILPFIGIVVAAYAFFVFLGATFFGTTFTMETFLADRLFGVTLPSTDVWSFSVGDLFLVTALIMLGFEKVKSTGIGRVAKINHVLSMIVFLAGFLLFLLVPGFATTVFFLIVLMTLIDTLGGMLVSIVTARRDIGLAHTPFGQ